MLLKKRLSITNTRCEFWKGKQFLLQQWHQSCCSCWEIDMQSFESLEFRIHQSIPNDNHGILHSWKCHQICFINGFWLSLWYLQIVEKQLCIQINVTEYWRGKQNGNDNAIDNIWYNLNDDFVNANAKECCSVDR